MQYGKKGSDKTPGGPLYKRGKMMAGLRTAWGRSLSIPAQMNSVSISWGGKWLGEEK